MVFSVTSVSLIITAFALQSQAATETHDQLENTEYWIFNRQARAAKIVGTGVMAAMRATQNIVKNADEIVKTPDHRVYKKTGGYEQAMKDFRSVDPTDVQKYKGVYWGNYGKKKIMLQKNGWHGQPTVDILTPFNKAGEGVQGNMITITYKE